MVYLKTHETVSQGCGLDRVPTRRPAVLKTRGFALLGLLKTITIVISAVILAGRMLVSCIRLN